jgi:Uma2 family endonuclease
MSTVTGPREQGEQRLVLHGLDWAGYEALLGVIGDRHLFVTYDRGMAELMYPSYEHENRSEVISKMITAIVDGLNIPIKSGGSTTFRSEDLDRGLEPDKCFWIAHELSVRSKRKIDLSIDPPPDLCVEVEMSSRLMDRVAIYAALGVPELWRDDGRHLRVFTLTHQGVYVQAEESPSFPTISPDRLNRYLDRAHGLDETTWMRKVRRAARKHRPDA